MHTHSNNGGDLPKAVEDSNLSKSFEIGGRGLREATDSCEPLHTLFFLFSYFVWEVGRDM